MITTSSILQAAINAVKQGRTEDALWRLDMVMTDVQRAESGEEKPQAVSPEIAVIFDELERATKKFPKWPTDPLHALAVLGEEFGELAKDMLQLTYEPHKTTRENVRTEAMQTAAMAIRLFMSLDTYNYKRGEQHSQADDQEGDCLPLLTARQKRLVNVLSTHWNLEIAANNSLPAAAVTAGGLTS